MSIGEYAGLVELSVSAVRFYADRGLLAPAATDAESGYRYYTQEQVPQGLMIRDLRLMDMKLAEIQDVLAMAPPARDTAVQQHLQRLENHLSKARGVANAMRATPSDVTTVASGDLARAIVQVAAAAGRDPLQPHLMCMLIEVRDNSLRFAATDSYRLAVRDLVPVAIGHTFSAIVAAAAIYSWPDAIAGDGAGDITLELDGEALIASGSGLVLRCPTIPLTFPDYEAVLRSSARLTTTIVVDRQELLLLLETFDGDGTVALATSDSHLVAERGGIVRRVVAEVNGAAANVAVNPRFAADAAEQAVGTELIIEIDDEFRPLTFRSADDGTYTSMLMPVRVD